MKGYVKRNKILCFSVLLAIAAMMATVLLFVSCAKADGGDSTANETECYTERDTETKQEKDGMEAEIKIDCSTNYSYGIGYVGNKKDPVYTSAVSVDKYDDKETYIHRFDTKQEVKSFLVSCASFSNYYLQDIANSIYCYDDKFFETNSVFMVFIHYYGDGMRYTLSGIQPEGETVKFNMTEYVSESTYKVHKCWVTSFAVNKESLNSCNKYKTEFKQQSFSASTSPMPSTPDKVKLDFNYTVDYTVTEPEYSLKSVYTGLTCAEEVKETALNRSSFSDKIILNFPVHTFTDSDALMSFWGALEYPEEKKAEVKSFLSKYDGEFFKEKSLLTVFAYGFCSDTVYKVDRIRLQANTLQIELQRAEKGIDYSSGHDAQLLAFEMNKEDLERCYYFKAYINNEDRGNAVQPPCEVDTFALENREPFPNEAFDSSLNGADGTKINNGFRKLPIFRIENKEELTKLFGAYSKKEGGQNWTDKYDEGFFKDHVLFAVYNRSYSAEAVYEVSSLYITDDNVNISYKKTESDGGGAPRVWITTVAIVKKFGRATMGNASVSETPPNRAPETKLEDMTEANSFIEKYTNVKMTQPVDENSLVFTKALNKDKLKDTDGKHIPIHLFTAYKDYKEVVGQIADADMYFREIDFETKDVYALYIDKNLAKDGEYDLSIPFVRGSECTMAMAGRNMISARVEVSAEKPAWLVMFYCDKGYFNNITDFDAYCTSDVDELKALVK